MNKIKIIIAFVLSFMLGALYTKALSGSYKVGDIIEYNGISFYVMEDSDEKDDTVKLLKTEPLTYEEVGTYSAGTGEQTYNINGYGGMRYHASSSDYKTSYIKTTVDAWKAAKAPLATEARLLTVEDIYSLGYEWYDNGSIALWQKTDSTPSWMYNSNYYYWTMSPYNDSDSNIWRVSGDGLLDGGSVANYGYVVRPVIVLLKDKEDSAQDNTDSGSNITEPTEVDVPNTLFEEPYISTIVGGIIIIVSIIVCVVIINNKSNRKKDKDNI